MPATSFTFRCFQCNKLLGVARSRAGSTVTCPKCGIDLIVPDPPDEAPTAAPAPRPSDSMVGAAGAVEIPEPAARAPAPASPPPPAPPTSNAGGIVLPIQIETEPISLRPEAPSRPHRIPSRSGSGTGSVDLTGAQEAATSIASRDLYARRNDVVLPRTAVILWCLTMLLAIVVAFGAGLLAGQFFWTEPVGAGGAAPPAAASKG